MITKQNLQEYLELMDEKEEEFRQNLVIDLIELGKDTGYPVLLAKETENRLEILLSYHDQAKSFIQEQRIYFVTHEIKEEPEQKKTLGIYMQILKLIVELERYRHEIVEMEYLEFIKKESQDPFLALISAGLGYEKNRLDVEEQKGKTKMKINEVTLEQITRNIEEMKGE